MGLPGWLSGKESTCYAEEAGDPTGSISGMGRSPGGGHGNPLQYSCLGESHGQGTWQAAVHRVTQSRTRQKQLTTTTQLMYNII